METIRKAFHKFIVRLFDRHVELATRDTGQREYERWLDEQW